MTAQFENIDKNRKSSYPVGRIFVNFQTPLGATMGRSDMKLTERQKERLVSYLDAHARDGTLKHPVKVLAQLLLDDFGIPTAGGREAIKIFLNELENAGKIRRTRNGNESLTTVQIALPDVKPEMPLPIRTATKIPVPTSVHILPVHRKGRPHAPKKLKKGEARRRMETDEVGDRNEGRCYRIANHLVILLKHFCPQEIISAVCTRSKRHCPEQGRIDVADRHGEDVGITIVARIGTDGATLCGRIVHDAKSSGISAWIANQNICFGKHERETNVLLKRAIAVHRRRSD